MNEKLKIGIGSYTYTWAIGIPGYDTENPMSAFDLMEKAVVLKARVVQFADNMPLHDFSDEELNRILSFAQMNNLQIEVGAKGLFSENLARYIDIAEKLNSAILRIVIDEKSYTPSPEQVVKVIRPFIPKLESGEIKLAIENHDRLKCGEFVYIVEACNSPFVGICLDTVNSLGVPEGTEQVMHELLPYTVNLHIKDFQIERLGHKMGFKVEGTPAGKGKLGIPSLLDKLRKLGKCKTAILELWTPFGSDLKTTTATENKWAVESMNYLNTLIQ